MIKDPAYFCIAIFSKSRLSQLGWTALFFLLSLCDAPFSALCFLVRPYISYAKIYYTPTTKTSVYDAIEKQKSSILSKNGR